MPIVLDLLDTMIICGVLSACNSRIYIICSCCIQYKVLASAFCAFVLFNLNHIHFPYFNSDFFGIMRASHMDLLLN